VEELRKEFIEAANTASNFSSLCREFGITRKTGYKWLKRCEESDDLTDRSHVPHCIPGKTPEEIERIILNLRSENPGWGAKTLRKVLENNGYANLPCVRTINNILLRNGCISEAESQKRKEFIRFQREYCNELWQVDFKGDFALLDGTRCFPLDILDDCSRYCLRAEGKSSTQGVRQSFEATFVEFGLPKAILSDNGAQFAGFKGGYTQFERWLMDLDIIPIHGRIMHPQTQGKIERFHRTMKTELLEHRIFANLSEASVALDQWRIKYNEVRPHEALGMKCPAEVYIPSQRSYPTKIEPYEYSGLYHMIKVNNWGYLRFDNIRVFLSETMADTYLEIRPTENDSFWVCYRNYRIAEIDAITGKLLNRRIYRLL
jgi:transposase InsO family protein